MSGKPQRVELPDPFERHPWMDEAACLGAPAEFFFADDGDGNGTKGASYVEAAAFCRVCRVCPVIAACLEYGWNDPWGFFGGMTARQRARARQGSKQAGLCVDCGREYVHLGKHRMWAHGKAKAS